MSGARAEGASAAPADLSGRVALVMGASRGIGAAAARAFAATGATVVLAARDAGALEALAAELRAAGGEALAMPTDVRDAGQVQRVVDEALRRFGRLDAAFNNAGGGHPLALLGELPLEVLDEAIAVNLRGTLLALKFELCAMAEAGRGAIVNMSSTSGLHGVRGLAAYSAVKHGVIGATRSAALDYAAAGIRVNAVAPGPIATDRIARLPEAQREPIRQAVPLGRIGRPEDVAAAVVWLCSDAAAYLTGIVLPVDGGQLAGPFRTQLSPRAQGQG